MSGFCISLIYTYQPSDRNTNGDHVYGKIVASDITPVCAIKELRMTFFSIIQKTKHVRLACLCEVEVEIGDEIPLP